MRPDLDTPTLRISMVVPRCRKGSTLIEVLTAVVIFSIVLTAAFATFNFQKQSYTTQTRVAEMQQNLRFSLDTLLRDIRMGGYGLNSNINVPLSVVGGGSGTIVMRGFQGADGGTSAPDGIYILYAYDMDNTVPALQPTLTTASVAAGNGGVTVSVTPGTGTRFSAGDVVVLHDGASADLYQVASSDNSSVTFGGTILTSGHSGNIYDVGSKLSRAQFVRYFIDNTTNPGHPTLMVTRLPGAVSQPVADDVEDLQFIYGIASSNDNVLVSSTANALSSDLDRQRIRRINLSIVVRTGVYERGWQGQRPTLGNRSAGSVDQYRRRIIDNVAVDIRNVRLN